MQKAQDCLEADWGYQHKPMLAVTSISYTPVLNATRAHSLQVPNLLSNTDGCLLPDFRETKNCICWMEQVSENII